VEGWVIYIVVALLTACSAMPQREPGPSLTRRPRTVIVELGSELVWKPLSQERLTNSMVQSQVAACERESRPHCTEFESVAAWRTTFSQAREAHILVLVRLTAVQPERDYECSTYWYGPDGRLARRVSTIARTVESSGRGVAWLSSAEPSKLAVGRWRVEVRVNGEAVDNLSFDVEE